MNLQEEEISSKVVFEGIHFRIIHSEVKLANGDIVTREFLESKFSTVATVLLDEQQNIYLVKQFRTAIQRSRLEIPGGRFFPEKGESAQQAAMRECREEVGMEPKKLELLFYVDGGGSWKRPAYYFLGTDLKKNPLPSDADEVLQMSVMLFRDYLKLHLEDQENQGRGDEFKAILLVAKKLGYLRIL